ncbi:GNAT family N-acetyltransferase [Alsobacter sp. SYSU BS001988]|jgi:ribosomal protein S18 acetylase RimI-like enzyme
MADMTAETRPDPALALTAALERHSARAWPAPEYVAVHGWELRFAPGSRSRRVNSLTAVKPEPGRFGETLALARKLCAQRDVPCTVRLTPLAGEEPARELAGMGFDVGQDATSVMVAPVGRFEPPAPVSILDHVTEGWLDGMAASGASLDERRLIGRLVSAVRMPQGFATAFAQDGPAAFGRVACERGVAGIFHVCTNPASRRQGHGRTLMEALLAWARAQGAMRAYLQVVAANAPAVALYREFGFREAYRYSYVTL